MTVVKELIRSELDGTLSFGDYIWIQRQKRMDLNFREIYIK